MLHISEEFNIQEGKSQNIIRSSYTHHTSPTPYSQRKKGCGGCFSNSVGLIEGGNLGNYGDTTQGVVLFLVCFVISPLLYKTDWT